MVLKFDITIPKLTGEEPRSAYIYLPDSYDEDPEKRYPVLYMFDGHNVFFDGDATYGKSWGLAEYLDMTGTQVIVAAVECNHSPDHGRLSEYAPFDFKEREAGMIRGKGKLTMDWIVHSFKPQVDKDFRTLPDRDTTWIAGSSMGGLMSLYALMAYNRVFGRAAALSPSLWTSYEGVERMVEKARLLPRTALYMDYGSREMRGRKRMRGEYGKIAAKLIERGVYVTCRIVPGGAHTEASWERQIPFFMETLRYEF